MSDESANIPAATDSDESSSKAEGEEAEAAAATAEPVAPAPSSSSLSVRTAEQQAQDELLTDSENTNNENRVIEMESGSGVPEEPVVEEPVTEEATSEEPEVKERVSEDSKVNDKGEDKYAEHVTYNEQGEAIYTDPETKFQYQWCKVKNEWVPAASGGADPYENEHYRWCHETKQWIPKENPKETEHYRWCEESGKWIPKEKPESAEDERKYSYVDGVHHYTDKDGAVYFWDEEKKAWFPKIDDEFMAIYQLSYGFTDNTSTSKPPERPKTPPKPDVPEPEEPPQDQDQQPRGKKRKAPPEPPKWFELKPEHNTKVYVSNMPTDVTEEEFAELMAKCGMVLKDPRTNKLKLKLYRDAEGRVKGDGLCHYIKIESVDLALQLLDNYDVRGHKIRVQQAEFQLKGEYNPSLKPKVKKKEKEKMKKMQEALFDWRPEKMRGERSKHERIVIIKNLFEPELFDREVHLLLEYQNDLREECNKCGTCRRVLLFDRHPEGVAQVTMSDPEEADLVVKLMHGRFFGKRKLTAEIWDGRTKYRVAETEADVNKRLDNWEKYLEQKEEAADEAAAKAAASAAKKPPKPDDDDDDQEDELPAPPTTTTTTPAKTVSDKTDEPPTSEIEPESTTAADDSAEAQQQKEEKIEEESAVVEGEEEVDEEEDLKQKDEEENAN